MHDALTLDRSVSRDPVVRRDQILSAAERCFVRGGFHRTTMQDVAAEARMSAGNVYRYFDSKDAIVAGIVARDRAEVARDFETLDPGDMLGSFATLIRRQVLDAGRDKAALGLEICAEAARNATVRELVLTYEAEIRDRLAGFFGRLIVARGAGQTGGQDGAQRLARIALTFLSGIMVSQAMRPTTGEAASQIDELLAMLERAVDGGLTCRTLTSGTVRHDA